MNSAPVPLEISVIETKRLLDEQPDRVQLVDVREPDEVAICDLEHALHLPMGQISERLAELPHDRNLLIYCHHGGRSMRVTQFLRAKGFNNTTNIAGGIDAWAEKLDPAMRRY